MTADDVQALRAFAQAVMGDWPDVGELDGFDLQQLGVKHGLLKPQTRYAPCCEEGCRCADGTDEDEWNAGITCFRKTPLLMVEAHAHAHAPEAGRAAQGEIVAWEWYTPVRDGTWHGNLGYSRPASLVGYKNVRPLYAAAPAAPK